MEDRLRIGLIVKPQGVRGQVKVQPLTDDINRYKQLKEVIIDQKTYRVTNAQIANDAVFLSLSGINDRNTAELFRGKYVVVTRENVLELPDDRYFIADIIGSKVVLDDNTEVGKVTDVTSARTDIFTVLTSENKVVRFPFLKDLLISVDVEKGIIILNKKRFYEVSCYED